MKNIRPSSELRNKYNEISNFCKESNEPVYITVNGHGDTVILNIEQYNRMIAELELLKMLAEAEDDVKNGRIESVDDLFTDLRKKLNV